MSFSRTIGALNKCGDSKTLCLDDILGIITSDLFDDIKITCGNTVVDLPVSNETLFIEYFLRLLLYVRKIAEKNQDILSENNRIAALENEYKKIDTLIGDIKDIEAEIKRMETALFELKSMEDEYKGKLAEKKSLEEQTVMKKQLLSELETKVSEADEIDNIIEDLSNVKIPEMDSYISGREETKLELISGIEKYNAEISRILSGHRDEALHELKASTDDFESIKSDWIDAETENKALVNQSEQYSSMIKKAVEDAEKLRTTLQLLMNEQELHNTELTKLEKRRQEEEAKTKEIKADSDRAAELLEKAISENLSISGVRDEFSQRLEDRKKEKEKLDLEIESLGESIKNYESEAARLQTEISEIKSNNSEVLDKINGFKARILEENSKYQDSISKMKNYRNEYVISKARADSNIKKYEIFLREYANIQSDYGRIIGDFLGDERLQERWPSLTDEDLRVRLNEKKNELDSLLKIELASISELLRQYDD